MAVTRREFLLAGGVAGAAVAAGVLVPLGFVMTDDDDAEQAESSGATGARLATFERTRIASLSDLAVGAPFFFDYPNAGQSNILVRIGERALGGVGDDHDVVAYSNLCTHMGCPITDYQAEHRLLGPCSCHFTTFDLGRDGIPALGQATQNLPRVLLEVDGDDLYAIGVFRLIYGNQSNLA